MAAPSPAPLQPTRHHHHTGLQRSHIIAHTIRSVEAAAERYPGQLHLLVIDNNSTDNTREVIAAALAETRKLVGRLIVETTRGKAHALSRGVAETETDYVIRIDADTQISPDAVWRIMRHFRDEHVGAAGGFALSPGGACSTRPASSR